MIILNIQDQRFKETSLTNYILKNRWITGIVIQNDSEAEWFYNEHIEQFPNSLHEINSLDQGQIDEHKNVKKLLTGKINDFLLGNIIQFGFDCIVNQSDIYSLIEVQRKSYQSNFLVFLNSVRRIIFSFEIRDKRINIKWFGSHLPNVKRLDDSMNNRQRYLNIDLWKNRKHFPELISYAIDTNKKIILTAKENRKYDFIQFFIELEKQHFDKRIAKTKIGQWI